jgi:membrane associated rhomboid family serine protease
MNAAPQLAMPRLGRGVKALLAAYILFGLVGATVYNYTSGPAKLFWTYLPCSPATVLIRPWTLLTGGLLTDPIHWSHLIWTSFGFYFLGPDLERRWGTWRFLRFIALAIVAGFLLQVSLGLIAGGNGGVFDVPTLFGPTAALAALGVAWGRENADAQIRLYFLFPIRGRTFVWITLGFCILGLFFPKSVTEGVAAPFGGFVTGLMLAGSPSPIRTLYLRVKLAFLRRGGRGVQVDLDPNAPLKVSPRKRGGPPLRVVMGGVEDDKRPPKDKRYLN